MLMVGDDVDGYGEIAKAYYFPDAKPLVRTAPSNVGDGGWRPERVALATPRVQLTVPPAYHQGAGALRLDDDEHSAYHHDVWFAMCHGRNNSDQPGAPQLLGWFAAMDQHAYTTGIELLAQIDSDHRFGRELGDVESLRVHLTTLKLAAKNVSAVRATMCAE